MFRTSWPKMVLLGKGKMGQGVVQCWPNELVFTFGGSYVCANFDENRPRNATVRVRTDGQTQTDFIICLMLYAIATGQIITQWMHIFSKYFKLSNIERLTTGTQHVRMGVDHGGGEWRGDKEGRAVTGEQIPQRGLDGAPADKRFGAF